MQKPIQSMNLQRGINLENSKLYYSGDYHIINDITMLVVAKIPALISPEIFDGSYVYTTGNFIINYNNTGYVLNLTNKTDPSLLDNGECLIFVKEENHGYYLISSISLTSIELSNKNGDTIYGEWSPLNNINNAFTQIIEIKNTPTEIEKFFKDPVYNINNVPNLNTVNLSDQYKIEQDLESLNNKSIIPKKFIGNKLHLDFYYDISKKSYIDKKYIYNFLLVPDISLEDNFTKNEIDRTFYGFQFVSTDSVVRASNTEFIISLNKNGYSYEQFDCVVFVGFDDGFKGNVAERYKIRYKISSGLSPVADGSNTIILESFDYLTDLSKKPVNPFNFTKDTTFSDPRYKDKYSWDFMIDNNSYQKALNSFPSNVDGISVVNSLFSSEKSGHIVFSLNSFIADSNGVINAPFTSTLVGDFFVEIEIKDKVFNKTYTSSVTLNVQK